MRLRRARKATRGLTLLELLISVTLVALLSLGMLFAMGVGFEALDKANSHLMGNRRVLGAERVLERQVAGLIPVVSACGGPRRQFFQAGPGRMRFVSGYSLEEASLGYARVLDYAVIPGDRGEGVRLVVTEMPYTGPGSLCGDPNELQSRQGGPRPFVLADRLAVCRFSYLSRRGGWGEGYSGDVPPLAIRIDMVPIEPDPSRLQMGPMTIPVHATRDLRTDYVDVEPPRQQ